MHEYSIAYDIYTTARRAAQENRANLVKRRPSASPQRSTVFMPPCYCRPAARRTLCVHC